MDPGFALPDYLVKTEGVVAPMHPPTTATDGPCDRPAVITPCTCVGELWQRWESCLLVSQSFTA